MNQSKIAMGLAALLMLCVPVPAEEKAGATIEAADLEGGYTVISGEKFGEPEPESRIKGTTVRFTKDRVVVTTKDKEEVYGSAYTLETHTCPARIRMVSKLAPGENQVSMGLIEKDGDTIRLIYALPGGEPPTEFKTRAKQLMFVMKNEHKK